MKDYLGISGKAAIVTGSGRLPQRRGAGGVRRARDGM